MTPEQRVDLAYSKLGLREPFIAAVMTRVKREISTAIPTAATNGTVCKYNPDFLAKSNDEQLFGLVLHESCHVVLMHMWRRDGRDPSLWNYANDAIINAYIKSRGYSLPDGGVHVDWVRDEHSSEYVYDKLKKDQQNNKSNGGKGDSGDDADGSGSPSAGGFDGSGDLEDAIDEATRTDMEATIVTAAKMAKDWLVASTVRAILKTQSTRPLALIWKRRLSQQQKWRRTVVMDQASLIAYWKTSVSPVFTGQTLHAP